MPFCFHVNWEKLLSVDVTNVIATLRCGRVLSMLSIMHLYMPKVSVRPLIFPRKKRCTRLKMSGNMTVFKPDRLILAK